MADITYSRTFSHDDWIDNEDVVQAGGDRGFNKKFHELEGEFDQISTVVQKVNTAIASLGAEIAEPVTVGLTPILLPYGGDLGWSPISWSYTNPATGVKFGTFVEKPANVAAASGVLPLTLPNNATLLSLKVLGEQDPAAGAGQVKTALYQESRTAPYDRVALVNVKGLGDATLTNFPVGTIFSGDTKLYYLLVKATNAINVTIRLRGFQIKYQ